jgi:hypothetical protein
MTNTLQKFNNFFSSFKKTEMWERMSIAENSPYHREESVQVHTQMLLDWYLKERFPVRSDKQNIMTMLACVFHDVGKPVCMIEKFTEARGKHFSFAGHEIVSARMWIDYAYSDVNQIAELGLSVRDVHNIAFMIEYHLPFGMKDKKLNALFESLIHRDDIESEDYLQGSLLCSFCDLIYADQNGRLSDDKQTKMKDVHKWVCDFNGLTIDS